MFWQLLIKLVFFAKILSSRTFFRTLNFFKILFHGTKTRTFELELSAKSSLLRTPPQSSPVPCWEFFRYCACSNRVNYRANKIELLCMVRDIPLVCFWYVTTLLLRYGTLKNRSWQCWLTNYSVLLAFHENCTFFVASSRIGSASPP